MISLSSPVRTWAHDWPAGVKLGALSASTFALFFIESLPLQLGFLVVLTVIYAIPGPQFFRYGMSRLLVLWPFILALAAWHFLTGDYEAGAVVAVRLVVAVGLANLVTMTTALSDMIDVLSRLTAPLRLLGLNTRALEIAVALAIRMTPTMLAKGSALGAAWKARSSKWATWRIVLPFVLLALDDADHVADALKARGGVNPMEGN